MSADTPGRPPQRSHVVVGGAVGALIRTSLVALALALAPGGDVVAVLGANLLGAFALGWLVGRARRDERWARLLPLFGTGLLGALTTFSSLAEQVAREVLAGDPLAATVLGAASLAGGVAAAVAGRRLGGRGGGRVPDRAGPGEDGS